MSVMAIESIERVIKRNENIGRHWFSDGAMSFFKSRVSQTAYLSVDGKRSFFVSSEQGPHGPRMYSVRVQDHATGGIDTVGEFQEFAKRYNAHKVAMALADGRMKVTDKVYHTLDGQVVI